MFLKTLRVFVGADEIRAVPFKRGLNLIVDATPIKDGEAEPEEGKKSGNNVGKTTVLRCVDFCLGAKADPIYVDPEFKTHNRHIHRFLEEKNPLFELELEDNAGERTVIGRRFTDSGHGGAINGEELSQKEFETALRWILFRLSSTHPTLRELVPKFVRVEPTARGAILHWLPHGKNDNYESIWLTLFGFGDPKLLKVRRDIKKDIAKRKKQAQALGQASKSPRQELPVIQRQLRQARSRLEALSMEGVHERSLSRLSEIRRDINVFNQRVAELDAALMNVRQTLDLIRENVPSMTSEDVKELFEDVQRFIPGAHASYEELVQFHKKLLANKTKFIQRNEAEIAREAKKVRDKLEVLVREEGTLLQSFSDPGILADVRQISDEVARLSHRQGELEALTKAVKEVREQLAELREQLAATDGEIKRATNAVEENLEIFNGYFTEYSQLLYGESLLVVLQFPADGKDNVKLIVENLEGNEGSGKKKGQIAAFDLAYLRYRQEVGARTARFTLQDENEVIDATQLRKLFEIAQSIDGQYVLSVLQDRLPAVDFPNVDDCVIVRLSKEERFFRLP